MSIASYYKEKEKLLAEQQAERKILLAHGVSSDEIDWLHDEDYKSWKANRIFILRNITATGQFSEEALLHIRSRRSLVDEPYAASSFLDHISNKKLLDALRALKPCDRDLIKACLIDGATHEEYALRIKKSRPAITRKLMRIKKRLATALEK